MVGREELVVARNKLHGFIARGLSQDMYNSGAGRKVKASTKPTRAAPGFRLYGAVIR